MDPTRLTQLKDYVEQSRDAGLTYDQVKAAMIGGGWTEDEANEYLPVAWAETEAAMAAPVAPPVAAPPIAPPVMPATPAVPPTYAAPVAPAYAPFMGDNTSGTPGAPVPAEVEQMGWSWGGFGLNWIWGIGNRVYIALLALIPCVNIGIAIWLGISGHKLAWQSRRFESMEQFRETMKAWNKWGLILFIANIVLSIVYGIIGGIIGAMQAGQQQLSP